MLNAGRKTKPNGAPCAHNPHLSDGHKPQMIVAQLSDPHVVAPPGQGELMGVDTAAALVRALDAIAALTPKVTHIVITGDLVNKGKPAEYSALAEVLARASAPIRLVPGNHDDRDALRAAFPDHAYLRETAPFVQYTDDLGPCLLVALDTLMPGRHDAELDAARLDWFDAAMRASSGKPVIVAMHHPPFVTGLTAFDELPFAGRDAFVGLVARYPHIERIVCGHNHRALQRRMGGAIVSVCPSTAFAYAPNFGPKSGFKTSAEPPGFQIHLWTDGALVTHTLALPATIPTTPQD